MPNRQEDTKMADFLYVFRGSDGSRSPQQQAEQMKKWGAWIKGLSEKGYMKSGEPLERGGKTIRGARKNVTDGPYAEAKDLVGGFLLVSAQNLETATELAKGCPVFEDQDGSVEVRPIMKIDM